MPTHLTSTNADGVTVLRPAGSLDHAGVGDIGTAFNDAVTSATRVVVDLADVDLLCTPGITLILSAHRALTARGGRIVVAGGRAPVQDLLKRCRLDAVLAITPTAEAGLQLARR